MARYAADPAAVQAMQSLYQTSGSLINPVVTLHTRLDQQVPYRHEVLYLQKTMQSGAWPTLHQNFPPPDRYGHCMFTTDEVLDAFERAVARIPDVLECHLMAGSADFLLKLMVEDTEDFARIHRQYLARLPGVAQMQSSFALRTVVKTTALDL